MPNPLCPLVLLPLQSNVIELLIITVQLCSQSLHIVCFYCPPLKPQDLSLLINVLSPLGQAFTLKLLLVGDFNVKCFSLSFTSSYVSHHHYNKSFLSSAFNSLSYTLLIDLIFVPLSFHSVVTLLPPVVTSNHHAISLILSPPPPFHLHSQPSSSNKEYVSIIHFHLLIKRIINVLFMYILYICIYHNHSLAFAIFCH